MFRHGTETLSEVAVKHNLSGAVHTQEISSATESCTPKSIYDKRQAALLSTSIYRAVIYVYHFIFM
jgi:hypothetical protein